METKEKTRKCYKKPQVNQIKLVIGEAVLQSCKVAPGAPGKNKWTCEFAACKRSFGS